MLLFDNDNISTTFKTMSSLLSMQLFEILLSRFELIAYKTELL